MLFEIQDVINHCEQKSLRIFTLIPSLLHKKLEKYEDLQVKRVKVAYNAIYCFTLSSISLMNR